jgi:hypothetical protein
MTPPYDDPIRSVECGGATPLRIFWLYGVGGATLFRISSVLGECRFQPNIQKKTQRGVEPALPESQNIGQRRRAKQGQTSGVSYTRSSPAKSFMEAGLIFDE